MICPFCQHELDVEAMACPRCAAAYPRPGMQFRLKLRTLVLSGIMLLAASLTLVTCVLKNIDSKTVVAQCITRTKGGSCAASTRQTTLSAQSSQFGGTNTKSAELTRMLSMWRKSEQPTQNITPSQPSKRPTR